MNPRWDLLGIGCAAVDDLVYVQQYPRPDTKVQIDDERRQGGGLTATALVAAARLGAIAAYCTVLGDDELSQYTVHELEHEGIDCSPVIHLATARPYHSTIIVDLSTGQRTILYSAAGVTWPGLADVTPELISACRVLCIDQHAAAIAQEAIRIARAAGIPVVADIEGVANEDQARLLDEADHLIVGVELAGQVTGLDEPAEAVRALWRPGRVCCAVTAGARGCWYMTGRDEVRAFPAFAVKAVDTTGCGDVFHGAYAASLARGESIERAIQVATATSGLKALQPGGRAGIPARPAVERFLQEQRGRN